MLRKKSAFSLIELSIVILVIGILIAGVTQGSRLVERMRLTSARTQTESSPVNGIKNLVSWYETTSENSFPTTLDASSATLNKINFWYDISAKSEKNNASQATADNQPIYVSNVLNGLPTVHFDGTNDYFNLPDGTVPYNNSPYTIFFVARTDELGSYGLLGSGNYGTTNQTNAFRYDAGFLVNYWWDIDIISTASSINANQFYVMTFSYDLAARNIYINGTLDTTTVSSSNESTNSNNTIGVTNSLSEFMHGDIAEIIIFDRALKSEERRSIENYLSKKWGLRISS